MLRHRIQHANDLAIPGEPSAGPGIHRPHPPLQRGRGLRPVQSAIRLGQPGGVGHARFGLRPRRRPLVQRAQNQPGTQGAQRVVQFGRGDARAHRYRRAQQHRPSIQPLLHAHDGDAAFGVARQHGGVDRRRAPPARQQRGMDVPAAQARRVEHLCGQDQPIGGDDRDIGMQGGEGGVFGRIALQPRRGPHRQAQIERCLMHGAARLPLPAAGRPRRLGVDADNLMRAGQGVQCGHGEFGAAHEDDAHALCHPPPAERGQGPWSLALAEPLTRRCSATPRAPARSRTDA